MRDGEVFDRRLARLEEVLGHLRGPSAWPREQFLRDPGLQAQAERWLQLAAECTPDHANHLVAERGWRTPQSCRDSMRVLHEHEVIAEHLSRRMEAWAGLRKVLVHLHLDVGHERLWEVLSRDLDDLEAFAVAVSSRSG